MRRLLLLITTILVTLTLLPSPTVQTQQPEKDQFPKPHNPEKDEFPKPETYPQAGANCKDKRRLEPWLGTPDVGPGKSRCVLSVYNCQTDKTDVYRSAPRESGTVALDCSDYQRAMEALGRIEICCDPGSKKENCEPPRSRNRNPPWLNQDLPCQNRQQGTHSWGQNRRNPSDLSHTIVMCGQVIRFVQPNMGIGEGTGRMPPGVRSFDVCCDTWQNAVSTRSPCDPLRDIDCDGTLNEDDILPFQAPLRRGSSDDFVINSPVGNLFFWREIYEGMPRQSECKDCKWELVGVQYTCENKVERISSRSESLNAEYKYQATWKCPANGQTKVTTDSATMEGKDHRRGSRCCRCPTPPNRSWP